jgi:5'(3')-deoxyribonucleotidase
MGGMYTQQLRGFHRIIINPAFKLSESLIAKGFGRKTFFNPRKDGAKDFLVDGNMVKAFRELEKHQFDDITSEDEHLVFGLFGLNDDVVHSSDTFKKYFKHCVFFDGGHRLNDDAMENALLPVLEMVFRQIYHPELMKMYMSLSTLMDLSATVENLKDEEKEQYAGHFPDMPYFFQNAVEQIDAKNAFRSLSARFDVYIVTTPPWNAPDAWGDIVRWIGDHFSVSAYDRLIYTSNKDILKGDFLITSQDDDSVGEFEGFSIPFGGEEYKTWKQILQYFENM